MARDPIDIDQLIDRLNADKRLHASSHFSPEVYRDEPILKTGRQLLDTQQAARDAAGQTPRPDQTGKRSSAQRRSSHDDASVARGAERGATRGATRGAGRTPSQQDPKRRGHTLDQPALGLEHPVKMGQVRPDLRRDQASRAPQARQPIMPAPAPTEPMPAPYRAMRAISRWHEEGGHGRWLTEAELFVRQARLMADVVDDHPYTGTFKSYFPTYNAMSDQQLRGYFTWRAAVRAGDVRETSLSFAYVYLYELINGIGVATPEDGFRALVGFWQVYRAFAPEIDRYAKVWIRDYVVYHGLDRALLAESDAVRLDGAFATLRDLTRAIEQARAALPKRGRRAPALPLPPDEAGEARLVDALDALSTYRIKLSRLHKDHPRDLEHVVCAVYVRMLEYYRRQRKKGLLDSFFGEEAAVPYTMFASAVFFEGRPHPNATYELDPVHTYRCEGGLWTCTRVFGAREKSPRLGQIMRACDRKLRVAMGYPHLLKPKDEAKYLDQIIDREIDEWLAWSAAHAPRVIEIDLSRLSGIRAAAATTREALLVDEEREEVPATPEPSLPLEPDLPLEPAAVSAPPAPAEPAAQPASAVLAAVPPIAGMVPAPATPPAVPRTPSAPAAPTPPDAPESAALLDEAERTYLAALVDGGAAIPPAGVSEDMLVDAINEKLFDVVGDTVIEFGPDGPHIIDDYIDDVKGVI